MLDTFKRLTVDLPYRPKAIFPSEMFLFYREAIACDADHIIESGVGHGGSTAYLARLFPDVRITSIDRNISGALGIDVELISGDAVKVLPEVVSRSPAQRIAILIDGPKGKPAIKLAKMLLTNAKVRFVAVHDLAFEPDYHVIDSHAPEFRNQFGFLDADVGKALTKHPRGPGLTVFKCSTS